MVDTTKLRALLDVATARPWHTDVWYGNDDGGWAAIGPHCVASEADGFDDAPEAPSYDQAMADAALIAGVVNALPELLDEVERLKAAERRAEEAEAQVDASQSVLREICETCCAALGGGFETIQTSALVRVIRDRMHAAETERDAMRAEVEQLKALECPKCSGAGAVVVEGEK